MNINFSTAFSDFYHTRCFVLSCLILFTLLFSFRLDNTIKWSYWIVFTPLWIWKFTTIVGMISGSIVWCTLRQQRYERENHVQCKGMITSFVTNTFLLTFELLTCLNLEESNLLWVFCFVPLLILSLVSIGISIWSIRYSRSYEIELFCAINVLQFIFIALRLDNIITWSWSIVFVPLWITMLVMIIILVYLIVITIVMSRNQLVHNTAKTNKWNIAFAYSFFVVSIIVFEILFTIKLDNVYKVSTATNINFSYFVVSIPLHFAFFSLIFLCFNSRSGNLWWFGMRRDFCEIFLSAFPCMKLYGNIQVRLCTNTTRSDDENNNENGASIGLESPPATNQQQRFYFYSKEVNKKLSLLESSSSNTDNNKNDKNLVNIVLLDVPD